MAITDGMIPSAEKSLAKPDQTAMTVPLICAALSLLCLVIITFAEEPWFAMAGFVGGYSLFWISLSHQKMSSVPHSFALDVEVHPSR
jgi:hypothetical protein